MSTQIIGTPIIARASTERADELQFKLRQVADGYQIPEVLQACAQLIANSVWQTYPTRKQAFDRVDQIAQRIKDALAPAYSGEHGTRLIIPTLRVKGTGG